MNPFKIIIVIHFFFISKTCLGNDTTLLYSQRLQKLKSLSEWLNKRTDEKINIFKIDTTLQIWKTYDTLINLFFNKSIVDSNLAKDTDMLSVSLKYQFLKSFISSFDYISDLIEFDSLRFKKYKPLIQSNAQTEEDKFFERNVIILYFLIDGKEYDYLAFYFEDNSTNLIGLTQQMGNNEWALNVREFLNNLSIRKH